MKKYYTYQLLSSIDNIVFYIGKGSGRRCYQHISIATGNSKARNKNPKLYNKIISILNDGGTIIIEKLLETPIEKDALDNEIKLISEIGIENLCNLTFGGEGTSYPNGFSDSHRLNISKSKLGDLHPMKKKVFTDEDRDIISKRTKKLYDDGILIPYFKGKNHSSETKKKMSKSHIGKDFTEEHRRNLSRALSGRKLTDEHKNNLRIKQHENYKPIYLDYESCKEWISINYPHIKMKKDWFALDRDNFPSYIPKAPDWVYKKSNHYSGWISWKDFLNNK